MKHKTRKILSILIALVMVLGMLPAATAMAKEITLVELTLPDDKWPTQGMAIPRETSYPDKSAGVTAPDTADYEVVQCYYAPENIINLGGSTAHTEETFKNGNVYELCVQVQAKDSADSFPSGTAVTLNGKPVSNHTANGGGGFSFLYPILVGTEQKEWTVTFEGNGHGTPSETSRKVKGGEQLFTPEADEVECTPEDGYIFEGWYTDSACTKSFGGRVFEDMTLYAGWSKAIDTVALTFNPALNVGDTVTSSDMTSYAALADGQEHYSIESAHISDEPFGGSFTGQIENNKSYYIGFMLKADSGYMFDFEKSMSSTPITVNRENAVINPIALIGDSASREIWYKLTFGSPKTHTVKFESDVGDFPDLSVENGVSIRDTLYLLGKNEDYFPYYITEGGKDYIFHGWYTDSTFRTRADISNPVTGPITLYVKCIELTLIESASATFEIPKAGDDVNPNAITVTSGDSDSYRVSIYNIYEGESPTSDSKYIEGKEYGAIVAFQTKSNGIRFKPDAAVTINGKDVSSLKDLTVLDDAFIAIKYFKFKPAGDSTPITRIDFTVEEPVVGENPSITATVAATPAGGVVSSEYTDVGWVESDTNDFPAPLTFMNSTDTFKEGKYYMAVMNELPEIANGYAFVPNTTEMYTNGNSGISVVFGPLTAPIPFTDISATITLPTAGSSPVRTGTVDNTTEAAVTDVDFWSDAISEWLPDNHVFAAGEKLTIYVKFEPESKFNSNTKARLNGQEAEQYTYNNAYRIDYTVPASQTYSISVAPTSVSLTADEGYNADEVYRDIVATSTGTGNVGNIMAGFKEASMNERFSVSASGMTATVKPKSGLTKGTYTATVVISDSSDRFAPIEVPVTFTVEDVPIVGNYIAITGKTFPNGTVGTAYTGRLDIIGTKPIDFEIAEGSLPDGLTLVSQWSEQNTDIVVQGTPTKTGTFKFKIKASNAYDSKTTEEISVTISPRSSGGGGGGGGGSSAASYAITVGKSENGTVKLNRTGASSGSRVTVTPQPAEGYETDKITVTDKDGKEITVSKNSDGTFTFTMPASKVSVVPTFKKTEGVDPVKPEPIGETNLLVIAIDRTSYQLNGQSKSMDSAPFIDGNDRTMLPVRVIANALGITNDNIKWDNATKTASFTREDGVVVSCTVNSNVIKIGDEEVEIDTVPVIRNDRIYLPMRALFNAFNIPNENILWDAAARTVTVMKKD